MALLTAATVAVMLSKSGPRSFFRLTKAVWILTLSQTKRSLFSFLALLFWWTERTLVGVWEEPKDLACLGPGKVTSGRDLSGRSAGILMESMTGK